MNNSLLETKPELAKEWHPTKNEKLTPDEVTIGSHKKVWWLGSCGHEWQAEIKSRCNGRGCPYCAGRLLLKGFNDIKTTHPELLKEWDNEKNNDLVPEDLQMGSHTKVWWRCSKGHSWQASPNERISKGRRCPYCAHNPRVLPGENDLATVRPDLLQEWDYEKNTILPIALTAKSNKRIWWKCSKGHEWRTSVEHRANGSGCPYCAKGAQTSFPEQAIYYYVKKAYPDAINKYKDLFTKKGMELDVFIPSIKTGIEYDGIAFHRSERQLSNDRTKSTICNNNGIRLIRIKEDPTVGVFPTDIIISANYGLENALFQLASIVPNLGDIDLKKDEDDIRKGYLSLLANSSLLAINPDLCKEWNYEKNKTTPDMYSPNSNTRVWWKCNLGHEWKTSIDERNKGRKCPYCSNRLVLSGFNDLATKRPDLTKEWNSERNKDLDPTKILPGSGKKAWWKCKNGHEWQAEVSSRNKGAGCPYCAGFLPVRGVSDLKTVSPSLALEWHPSLNGMLSPENVLPKSNKRVWWQCGKCGHEWQATVGSRYYGAGCPKCGSAKSGDSFSKNRVLLVGSLLDNNPQLAKEWHSTKNGQLSPDCVTAGSSKKAWWQCSKCGHEWQAVISSRNRGNGCPACYRQRRLKATNNK